MIVMELHQDTRILADVLLACPFGETIKFDELSKAIGRDIQVCRHLLYRAIYIVERDNGAVFASIRRVGYKRVVPDDLHKIGQTARARIRSQARRGFRTISNGIAKANDISPPALREALREQSILGLVEHTAKDRNRPDVAEGATRPLPVAEVAREFLKKMGAT
jgi:hypothetical protein